MDIQNTVQKLLVLANTNRRGSDSRTDRSEIEQILTQFLVDHELANALRIMCLEQSSDDQILRRFLKTPIPAEELIDRLLTNGPDTIPVAQLATWLLSPTIVRCLRQRWSELDSADMLSAYWRDSFAAHQIAVAELSSDVEHGKPFASLVARHSIALPLARILSSHPLEIRTPVLAEMRRCIRKQEELLEGNTRTDLGEWFETDKAFQMAVVSATGSKSLVSAFDSICDEVNDLIRPSLPADPIVDFLPSLSSKSVAIIQGLSSCDALAINEAYKSHLRFVSEQIGAECLQFCREALLSD